MEFIQKMDFDLEPIDEGIARLKRKGIIFQKGLADSEIHAIEAHFHFKFPPDVRYFLQAAVPTDSYYVDWRGNFSELEKWFLCPIQGVLFDVSNRTYWNTDWGPRPESNAEATAVAEQRLAEVPLLIPIGDRFFPKCIPAQPCLAGNPVFSVSQTDILHAGSDIGDYLRWLSRPSEDFNEDGEQGRSPTSIFCDKYRYIPFWSDIVRDNAQ